MTESLDFSGCRLPPFAHQREDAAALVAHPYFFIASEMRTGKSKIVIDAAQFLFEADTIDRVLVVTPAPVRDVWYDQTLGELAKHLWERIPATVTEFHASRREWQQGPLGPTLSNRLWWGVTNYEFLRSGSRLGELLTFCGPKTLLVLDESSFVKNWQARQTKACLQLRRACGRVALLNGTPIFHSPLDLFSQGNLLHPSVLDCKYVTYFKARYAVQAPVLGYGGRPITDPRGKAVQKIVSWTNLDDLQRRFAPVTVRRLQKDCLDLPPKLDSVTLTATLAPETWRAYQDMKRELVVWLESGEVATAATAAIRVMRLSQITGGFLGGIEDARIGEESLEEGLLDSLQLEDHNDSSSNRGDDNAGGNRVFAGRDPAEPQVDRADRCEHRGVFDDDIGYRTVCGPDSDHGSSYDRGPTIHKIGREKLDVLLWFIAQRLEADPNLHLVAWCRFRAELFRTVDAVRKRFPQFTVGIIHGGQRRPERLAALALLKPETSPAGPTFLAGIEGTGSFGIDLCAAHTCVTMSSGYSPGRSAQTLDRVYGPNQKFPIAYFDVVAVGPKGQRTIDHQIIEARRIGEDIASWTATAWVKALQDE